jgi:hypothetical protein
MPPCEDTAQTPILPLLVRLEYRIIRLRQMVGKAEQFAQLAQGTDQAAVANTVLMHLREAVALMEQALAAEDPQQQLIGALAAIALFEQGMDGVNREN